VAIVEGRSTPVEAADQEARAELIDAVLGASRVLVAIAARSLAGVGDDVTLPQFRALVVLATAGPQRVADLAAELDVNASTATRMCDRLVRKDLVSRTRLETDRRTVRIMLTDTGRELIIAVMEKRRLEVGRIIDQLPSGRPGQLIDALRTFALAAGQVPEQHWSLGWDDSDGSFDGGDDDLVPLGPAPDGPLHALP
jgi:DNA-binding MarR family transcriptional regulator